jgi:protein SCO1/2
MPHSDPSRSGRRGVLLVPLALLLAACLLSLALYRTGLLGGRAHFEGTAYEPAEAAPEFRLVDESGHPARLADYRGKAVLLFFGYTHCPDVCPLTLTTLHRVLGSIGPDAVDARVLMVTIDPERDRPDTLARYVRHYGPEVHGLTGEPGEIARLAKEYGVGAMALPAGGPHGSMMHTAAIFGIDRAGRLRVLMRPDAPDEALASDVRTLLRG